MLIAPNTSRAERIDCEVAMRLASGRCQQGDFFIADIFGASPKDDIASMEYPLFALKAGDKRVRTYERNGNKGSTPKSRTVWKGLKTSGPA